ncbi:hypothetical protein Tco_1331543, partial [Tanacetum coccineum]
SSSVHYSYEIRTSTNLITHLNALIAELETSGDYELIAVAEEKIHGKEIDLEMLEAEGNDG